MGDNLNTWRQSLLALGYGSLTADIRKAMHIPRVLILESKNLCYSLKRLYFFISCSQGTKNPRGCQSTLIFITTWNLSGLNGSTQLLGAFWTLLQLYISLGKTEEGVVIGKWNVQNAWSVLLFEWSAVVLKTFSKESAVFNGKYHESVIKVVIDLSCEL